MTFEDRLAEKIKELKDDGVRVTFSTPEELVKLAGFLCLLGIRHSSYGYEYNIGYDFYKKLSDISYAKEWGFFRFEGCTKQSLGRGLSLFVEYDENKTNITIAQLKEILSDFTPKILIV